MKKRLWRHSLFYIVFAAVSVLASAAVIFSLRSCETGSFSHAPDVDMVIPFLANGDVILRSGVGMWSGLFRKANVSDHRFSHVGIIVEQKNGTFQVLHSEGNDFTGEGNVHLESLDEFIGASTLIGLARLHTLDPDVFVSNAMRFCGRDFDWQFDGGDDSKIYCTELVELSLKGFSQEYSMMRSNGIITVDACFDAEFFTEITIGSVH